jgi:molecular chaperone GrpE
MNKEEKKSSLEEEPEKKDKEKELQEKIEQLQEEKILLLADRENWKKRLQDDLKNVEKYAKQKIVLKILDFFANFTKTLKFMKQDLEGQVKKHLPTLQIMKKSLWKILEDEKVEEIKIEPKVTPFDGRYHEIILPEVENDEVDEGTVLEVVSPGYLLHQRTLKASQVRISKKTQKKDINTNNK